MSQFRAFVNNDGVPCLLTAEPGIYNNLTLTAPLSDTPDRSASLEFAGPNGHKRLGRINDIAGFLLEPAAQHLRCLVAQFV
jgi:hypothetical protein